MSPGSLPRAQARHLSALHLHSSMVRPRVPKCSLVSLAFLAFLTLKKLFICFELFFQFDFLGKCQFSLCRQEATSSEKPTLISPGPISFL